MVSCHPVKKGRWLDTSSNTLKNKTLKQDKKTCDTEERQKNAFSIVKIDQTARKNVVRAMLFDLSAPSHVRNEALCDYKQSSRKRFPVELVNSSTFCLLEVQRVCQHAFRATVQISRATITRLSVEVVKEGFLLWKPRLQKSRFGKILIQTALCLMFLHSYG